MTTSSTTTEPTWTTTGEDELPDDAIRALARLLLEDANSENKQSAGPVCRVLHSLTTPDANQEFSQ